MYLLHLPEHLNMISQNLRLETDKVILRPLENSDISSFARITNEAALWKYFTFLLNNHSELQRWVETALKEREEGKRLPFTIIEKATGEVCGSTSLGSISYYDKRIEIRSEERRVGKESRSG